MITYFQMYNNMQTFKVVQRGQKGWITMTSIFKNIFEVFFIFKNLRTIIRLLIFIILLLSFLFCKNSYSLTKTVVSEKSYISREKI